jgi:membrane associated rhomboid family serine protease
MRSLSRLLIAGFLLVLAGAVLPFLMVIGIFESSFFLNFVAYAASVVGLFLGIIAAATFVGESRRKDDDLHNQ